MKISRYASEVLDSLETEDQRQKKALRKHLERERTYKVPLDRWALLRWGLLCFVVATLILIGMASR